MRGLDKIRSLKRDTYTGGVRDEYCDHSVVEGRIAEQNV